MLPTPEADLRRTRESLEALVADGEISSTATHVLRETIRSLRRLERTWPRLLPYLVEENVATQALLEELAPLLPSELRSEIEAARAAAPRTIDRRLLETAAVEGVNADLRSLLARAIVGLPGDETGTEARGRALNHLKRTVTLRPW
jgi:hypothetical protein